jgi:hypothetical protein
MSNIEDILMFINHLEDTEPKGMPSNTRNYCSNINCHLNEGSSLSTESLV